jgi:hypothetical protein
LAFYSNCLHPQHHKINIYWSYPESHPVFTLSLGLLSPSIPSFSGICKVRKFYWISVWIAETQHLMHKVPE